MNNDWYYNRDDINIDDVFECNDESVVKVTGTVPGDATKLYVADLVNGSWSYYDGTVEPGEFVARIPDPSPHT